MTDPTSGQTSPGRPGAASDGEPAGPGDEQAKPDAPSLDPESAEPPGGPFGSWGRLYAVLGVYGVVTMLVLWWLTRTMNVTVGP